MVRSRLMGGIAALLVVTAGLGVAAPARAEIVTRDDRGFVVREVVDVGVSAPEVWRTLVKPATWWSSEHTFSGEAANLSLDPVPGGCFCEKLPPAKEGGAGAAAGGVQHMRVVYIEPGRALRLTGALGPLQSEALLGAMTITLKGNERGTRILIEYVVGGYMRYRSEQIAPAVDRMLGQQIARLADKLGGALASENAVPVITPPASTGDGVDGGHVPAPAHSAPQGPSLDPDGAPLGGRGSARSASPLLLSIPIKPQPAPPAAKPAGAKPSAAKTASPAKAPVAKSDSGKADSSKAESSKATPAKAAKPATDSSKPKSTAASGPSKPAKAPSSAKPAPEAGKSANESDARKDAQAAFDAALGNDSQN